jgi:hypothetical protein
MCSLLTALSRAWTGASAERVLDRWHDAEPSLRCYQSLSSITDAARGRCCEDLDDRDEVQRALLRLAVEDDDARLAMLHVLAPGLVQVIKTYALRWGLEETEAMVVASALERVLAFGRGDAGVRPASNIVLGVRNDLFKRRLRDDTRDRVLGEQVALDEEMPTLDRPAAGEELLGLVGEGVRSGAITLRGARLIVLHRIKGLSTAEVAAAEGRDAATVRKYRNRAEAALVDIAAAVA